MASHATLLTLPLEIRETIYDFAFRNGAWYLNPGRLEDSYAIPVVSYFPVTTRGDTRWYWGAAKKLLRTNMQIYR